MLSPFWSWRRKRWSLLLPDSTACGFSWTATCPETSPHLRADLHRLFDKGYVTVTPDRRLEVSSRLKADYSNGRSYYPLSGQTVRVPATPRDRPAKEFLTWHNENVYLG